MKLADLSSAVRRRRQRLSAFVHSLGARRILAARERPYRLHLGCGSVRLQGWVNIDVDASLATADVIWDLSRGLPVEDGSCELIYHEHLLEHMTAEAGVRFLRECRRALCQGGTMRVAMPSLDVILEKSTNGDWRDQDWLTWPGSAFIQTRAEMLNMVFRWWDHRWVYDREELHRRLREAGFETINDVEQGESRIPALQNLETRRDSLLICEASR